MHRKFCIAFVRIYLLSSIIFLGLNIWVDPFNLFNNSVTKFIPATDERKIKTSHLQNNLEKYDAVLIGSSRSSYIDVKRFKDYKMFNYSVSGITIDEYLPYLEYFKLTQNTPKLIILSLDFHGTNQNFESNVDSPNNYIQYANSRTLQLMDYAKIKTAHISLNMVLLGVKQCNDYYTRDLIKKRLDESIGLTDQIIFSTLAYYKKYCLNKYLYQDKYKKNLETIRTEFPNAKIIVVICPIHDSLIQYSKKIAGHTAYDRWLSEIKEVYMNYYDFNKDELLVQVGKNFFDAAHFYPFVGNDIVDELSKNIG